MATFVSTTLTKRTGATTTVFNPAVIANDVGVLAATSTLAGLGATVSVQSKRAADQRRTSVTVRVPQLSADGLSVLRYAQAKLELTIPDGMPQNDVNDIVGYINSATSTSVTNLDDVLVDGVGVF